MESRNRSAILLCLSQLVWAGGVRSEEAEEGITRASVGFVSNRDVVQTRSGGVRLGATRDQIRQGRCEVKSKPIPWVTDVAPKMPFYVQSETNEVRIDLEEDREAFWSALMARVETSRTGSVVVFVHGYSYDFERGCLRAAEMQRALQGDSSVLLFSWPSNGKATDYMPDVANLEWSVPHLAGLLRDIREQVGADNLHVLSHSLGARGVVLALESLRADGIGLPVIGRWVLLAPDLDSQTFVEALPRLAPSIGDITLYASSNDTPLKVSQQLSGSPRLGQAGEYLTVAEGMETVDVSPAGRYQVLGHEYFFFHPVVAADLVSLLREGTSATERDALRPRSRDGVTYWEIVGKELR